MQTVSGRGRVISLKIPRKSDVAATDVSDVWLLCVVTCDRRPVDPRQIRKKITNHKNLPTSNCPKGESAVVSICYDTNISSVTGSAMSCSGKVLCQDGSHRSLTPIQMSTQCGKPKRLFLRPGFMQTYDCISAVFIKIK